MRYLTRSSATAETARDADDVDFKHSRSLTVIRCLCQSTRYIRLSISTR